MNLNTITLEQVIITPAFNAQARITKHFTTFSTCALISISAKDVVKVTHQALLILILHTILYLFYTFLTGKNETLCTSNTVQLFILHTEGNSYLYFNALICQEIALLTA